MTTNTTAQIATFLNVSPNQVKSVTEMAWVFCVVVRGCRARFVSKKIIKVETKMTDTELGQSIAKAIKATGNSANFWQQHGMTRVYVKGSGGASGYIVVSGGEIETRLTGYGQSDVILAAARSVAIA